jgi:Icc-related predicted phosphoesterase
MRVLVISDLHGDLDAAWRAIMATTPDLLLSCGDWGDPDQVSADDLAPFTDRLPVLTVFGNHDPLDALAAWRNQDGTPVLLANGEVRTVAGLTVSGISGIWAKSNRLPHYITDRQVAAAAESAATAAPVLDLLLTHGCASGLADRTPRGTSGGQRCFLEAFHRLQPRLYLCGHLHRQQERRLASGQVVANIGATPKGECGLIQVGASGLELQLLRLTRGQASVPSP